MNFKTLPLHLRLLAIIVLSSVFSAVAQAEEAEKVEIPTEISEPPYEVGQLPVEQGYYIKRGDDQTQINFRVVSNQMRVYWIDENGLIAEPEATAGNVRFTSSVRGRNFYGLTTVGGDAGIGASGIIPAPHIFNLILTLEGSGEPSTHNFRYTANLDIPKLPDGATAPAGVEFAN
ncbi:MAG: hypothetical protein ACSHYA_08980 [Opitutaceae bacterium]